MNTIRLMIAVYVLAAVAALLFHGYLARRISAVLHILAAILGIGAACAVLSSGARGSLSLASVLPYLSLSFELDPIGAFFLLLIGAVTAPVALYGIGYAPAHGAHGHSRLQSVLLSLFLLSMNLVVLASNVLTFLFFWEIMSLASYFLVLDEDPNPETLEAGRWYAGMAHAGFGCIAAALLLAGLSTSGMEFSQIRVSTLAAAWRTAIFLLALIGFGSKAGLVPLHVWLPRAHTAAPSPISALMSAVMVKLGVYGLLRVSLDLLGGGPAWWGGVILVLGTLSALLGVLYALMESDLKRLLAYSTVENVGIVFMGVGLGLLFQSYAHGQMAALALVAGMFHALNHSCFKGLLFMGGGAVLHATGTRDMEKMGGLIHRMPQTAACFLIGAAAISALPPLNGFASEWMIFQSLMAGVRLPNPLVAALMAVTVGMLALTGGLAAACFVKAFGISFLALPRSEAAEHAHEVPVSMRWGMMILALACVLLGLTPSFVIPFMSRALAGISGLQAADSLQFSLSMKVPGQDSSISPLLLALCLMLFIGVVPLALRILGANFRLRRGEAWGCGRIAQSARMEYTSASFAEPLRRVFGGLYRPAQDVTIDFHPESKYFAQSIEYRTQIRTWLEDYLYEPLFEAVRRLGSSVRVVQSGSVHGYISYIFVALLVFLLLARWL